ncbi:MarR family transcriptional regulator [Brachyspira hyodysenteriae]|nr:MarR family transcriptional regulator [Brachyspira hyodysenteriae]AUJ50808.1 MarR family transcriptional regulator [Brachyspira hyodysenteriae]MCZ9887606.1 MarR family transcriptional regulator [Brachyspira hyodysenteriae]MCZ9890456.1 MarR family transcriptional regulator [Brachyspira hyodysenteriae]MCZ9920552.1 MarR family transcriptional regulator [Brachyspira hyodysenteriae]MCZ9926056.1 MarR family transcriptional regulator [Brachyspira hyodysenteriae]
MEDLHYLLMKTNSIFARRVMHEANKIGLTSGQPKVLYFLSKFKEADQKTIANYLEIEQTTVGSILLGMEKSGLIERKQHEGNRRSLYVSLTEKGKEYSKCMLEIFDRIENKAIKNIPKDKQEELKSLLIEISKSLTDNGVE